MFWFTKRADPMPPIVHVVEDEELGRLSYAGRADLETLPETPALATVVDLDLSGCTRLRALPARLPPRIGRLLLGGCGRLTSLPERTTVGELELSGCAGLVRIPNSLRVLRKVELAGTELLHLGGAARARLSWRGVDVDEDVVLRPQTITAAAAMGEANLEVRRVMIERMGYERFLEALAPRVLDEDHDAGGPRRLLEAKVPRDENLVVLEVRCPSTSDRYLLRVPPTMKRCHQAAAWLADVPPEDYRPARET